MSIITVTFNAETVLESTIQSIINQTYTNYEYLIIDGGSKDGTVDIISRYQAHITQWISEPDKGLYDAMNKGLQMARGKYVWFMNAGDRIYAPDTLARLVETCLPDADIYYGDALFFDDSHTDLGLRSEVTPHQLPEVLTWKSFRFGMVVCHQSFIARRTLVPFYDLSHHYSSDIDWEIRCLKAARTIVHTHLTLSRYLTGGFSKKNHRNSLKDRYKVLEKHFGVLPTIVNHIWITLRGIAFLIKRRKGY